MTTFADLLSQTSWKPVSRALHKYYGCAEFRFEPFHHVFATLKKLDSVRSSMRICLERSIPLDEDDEPGVFVSGRDGTLNCQVERTGPIAGQGDLEWAHAECRWELCGHPWREWLGMTVEAETLKNFPVAEVVAHCLWGMTWWGFDESKIEQRRRGTDREAGSTDSG